MVAMLPEILMLAVALLATVGEWIHSRRIKRVGRLAFGPSARPAAWTWAVPSLRVVALSLACWGFASLFFVVPERIHNTGEIPDNEYKHLVLLVDVSPSMLLKDAGPEGEQTRRQRAADLVSSLFQRVPLRQFKISFIGVYSDAKPLLEDSRDYGVVRHIMEEMPLWHGFEAGKTNLMAGISMVSKLVKPWYPKSTYVVMLTDGDTVAPTGMPKLPVSVAEFLVVGVGNENQGTFIDGHQSRQDASSLRQIANRVGGRYHNGNQKHLPSTMVSSFQTEVFDKASDRWTRREWALLALLIGSSVLAVVPMLLHYFGSSYVGGTVKHSSRAEGKLVQV